MSNLSTQRAGQLISPQDLFKGITIRPNSPPPAQHPKVEMAQDSVQVQAANSNAPAVAVQFAPPAQESPAVEHPPEQVTEAPVEVQSPVVEKPDPAIEQREADKAWARALENKIMNGERPSPEEMQRYNSIQWAEVKNPLE